MIDRTSWVYLADNVKGNLHGLRGYLNVLRATYPIHRVIAVDCAESTCTVLYEVPLADVTAGDMLRNSVGGG